MVREKNRKKRRHLKKSVKRFLRVTMSLVLIFVVFMDLLTRTAFADDDLLTAPQTEMAAESTDDAWTDSADADASSDPGSLPADDAAQTADHAAEDTIPADTGAAGDPADVTQSSEPIQTTTNSSENNTDPVNENPTDLPSETDPADVPQETVTPGTTSEENTDTSIRTYIFTVRGEETARISVRNGDILRAPQTPDAYTEEDADGTSHTYVFDRWLDAATDLPVSFGVITDIPTDVPDAEYIVFVYASYTDTDPAADLEPVEAAEEYPAQAFTGTAGYLRVDVEADEGAFPEDTRMHLAIIPKVQAIAALQDMIDRDDSKKGTVVDAIAVDIAFYDTNGNEIQPLIPGGVHVVLTSLREIEGDEHLVAHVDDNGNATEVTGADITPDAELPAAERIAAEFDAHSFSIYAIGGTEELDRATYIFYAQNEAGEYEEWARQTVINGDTLGRPRTPESEGTRYFTRWYVTNSSGGRDNVPFGTVSGIDGDITISAYAEYYTEYIARFYDTDGASVADTILVRRTDEEVEAGLPVVISLDDAEFKPETGTTLIEWTHRASGTVYGTSASYTFSADDLSAGIAEFDPVVAGLYKIEFYGNAGDDNTVTFTKPLYVPDDNGRNASVIAEAQRPAKGTSRAPERAGYTFTGWYRNADLSGGEFDLSTPVTSSLVTDGVLKLYAGWQGDTVEYDIFVYKEVLDKDGHVQDPKAYELETVVRVENATSGELIRWDSSMEARVIAGFEKSGYYEYASSDAETVVRGDEHTVFHVYYNLKEIPVTFITSQGYAGTGGSGQNTTTTNTGTVFGETSYTFNIRLGEDMRGKWPGRSNVTVNRSGYVFRGWFWGTKNSPNSASSSYKLSGNAILTSRDYATEEVFQKNANGDPQATTYVLAIIYYTTNQYTVQHWFRDSEEDDYVLNSDFTETVYLSSGYIQSREIKGYTKGKAERVSGTAIWNCYYTKNNTYKLLFHNWSVTMDPISVTAGTSLSAYRDTPANIEQTPFDEDEYEFTGWYMDAAHTTPVDWDHLVMPEYNLMLYANYMPKQITISFDRGIAPSAVLPSSQTLRAGDHATSPANASTTAIGYTFLNWYIPDDTGGDSDVVDFANRRFFEDTTLVAEWSVTAEHYALKYTGVKAGDVAPVVTQTYDLGSHIFVRGLATEAEGSTFQGWHPVMWVSDGSGNRTRVVDESRLYYPGSAFTLDSTTYVSDTNELEFEAAYGATETPTVDVIYHSNYPGTGKENEEKTVTGIPGNSDYVTLGANTFSYTGYKIVDPSFVFSTMNLW